MLLSAFKSVRTENDLDMLNGLIKAYCSEHNCSPSEIVKVTDTEYPELSYKFSTTRNHIVSKSFFTTKENGLFGMVSLEGGCQTLKRVTPTKYVRFETIASDLISGYKQDGSVDIYYTDKLIAESAGRLDILRLGGELCFLQIDFDREVGLICYNNYSSQNPVYIPKDEDDFNAYYDDVIERWGYQGYLDCCCVSDIFRIKLEVQWCIFQNAKYKYLGQD